MAGLVQARAQGAVRILWALLVASIAIPSILLAVATWQSRDQALSEADAAAGRIAQTLLAQVQNIFQTYELVLDRVQDTALVMTDEELLNVGSCAPEAQVDC